MEYVLEKRFDQLRKSGLAVGLTWQDFELLSKQAQGFYLEIGTLAGASAWTVSFQAKKVWTIDKQNQKHIWEESEYLRDNIEFLFGESTEIAKGFEHELDSLFVDGDHSFEGVTADIEAWWPKLRVGGLAMFHDFSFSSPGVLRRVMDLILSGKAEGKVYWPPENSSIVTLIKRG